MSELIGRWNYYFLRYAVGTIIGALIVLFLTNNTEGLSDTISNLLKETKDGKIELGAAIAVFTAFGLAYCYIASAPGAVFHAARGLFSNRKSSDLKKVCWLSLGIPFVACLVVYPLIFIYTPNFLKDLNITHTRWLLRLGIILSAFIFFFQVVLLVLMFENFKPIKEFYTKLTESRSKKANNIQNYRKSYRDLREHGNAFEIIILELLLASLFLGFGKKYFVLVLAMWVLPAAACWIVGTLLEFEIPAAVFDKKPSSHAQNSQPPSSSSQQGQTPIP